MAEWLSTWSVAVVALAVLVLPGVLPAFALGLRGLTAWGSAPLLGGAVVGVSALMAPSVGLPWGVGVVGAGVLAASVLALGVWFLSGRRRSPALRVRSVPPAAVVTIVLTTLVAVGLQARRVLLAVGAPDRVAQTFDTPYHLNSVSMILDRGDASSLHMTLTTPDQTTAFYPALWHGYVALVTQLTGAAVPVAANWVSIVIATAVWLLGLLALVRVLLGWSPVALAATPVAAFLMTQFPNRMMSFGILYPNLLSYALLPAALALAALALLRTHGRGRLPALAGVAAGVVALVLAQPNGVFALAYVVIPLVAVWLGRETARLRRAGRPWPVALLPWPTAVAVGAALYAMTDRIALVEAFRGKVSWGVETSPRRALLEAASLTAMHPFGAPNFPEPHVLHIGSPNWVVAAMIVVGGILCLRPSRLRWLPVSYAVLVVLYVVVRGVDLPIRALLTGYWYADPQRLAALLPLVGVPLLVVAITRSVTFVTGLVGTCVLRHGRRQPSTVLPLVVVTAVTVVGAVILPRTAHYQESFDYLRHVFRVDPHAERSDGLVDADELAVMAEIPDLVPPGVSIVGDPWDGSSMAWTLAGRQTVFPHTGTVMDADRLLLADHLRDARTDPAVCDAVRDLNVGFVLSGGRYLWGGDPTGFPGLDDLEESGVARLVASQGDAKLYEITAC